MDNLPGRMRITASAEFVIFVIFAIRETKPHEKCRLVTEKCYLCTVRGEIPGNEESVFRFVLKSEIWKI